MQLTKKERKRRRQKGKIIQCKYVYLLYENKSMRKIGHILNWTLWEMKKEWKKDRKKDRKKD